MIFWRMTINYGVRRLSKNCYLNRVVLYFSLRTRQWILGAYMLLSGCTQRYTWRYFSWMQNDTRAVVNPSPTWESLSTRTRRHSVTLVIWFTNIWKIRSSYECVDARVPEYSLYMYVWCILIASGLQKLWSQVYMYLLRVNLNT